MPVPAQVRFIVRHYHQVKPAHSYNAFASGTYVALDGRVRLYVTNAQPPRNAHATKAAVSRSAPTTMTTSAARRSCLRNGLKPIGECYRGHRASSDSRGERRCDQVRIGSFRRLVAQGSRSRGSCRDRALVARDGDGDGQSRDTRGLILSLQHCILEGAVSTNIAAGPDAVIIIGSRSLK